MNETTGKHIRVKYLQLRKRTHDTVLRKCGWTSLTSANCTFVLQFRADTTIFNFFFNFNKTKTSAAARQTEY
jgi:hypothetical protein